MNVCVCVMVVGGWMRGVLSVNLCKLFRFTIQPGERERERKKGDERENQAKGTENKWSGRKNKTGCREGEPD